MQTQILKIDKHSLELAKRLLLEGQLVAFPTETVYGLGADATNARAVKAIFEAKGRPSDNPLIVHVHKDYDITKLVDVKHEYARQIAQEFLPGPLTMVYDSKGQVCSEVSCNLSTLAIRVPQKAEAQQFLKFVDLPIAAPSANISKHTSAVTAIQVYEDFNGKIPLILDGGKCEGGIESTVLDVTGDCPVILRKGLVTAGMIKQAVGKCEYAKEGAQIAERSPGMKYKHYCPHCETKLFARNCIGMALELYKREELAGKRVCFLADEKIAVQLNGCNVLNLGATAEQMASNLYDMLHIAEQQADLLISFELEENSELDLSVNNRFKKAFGKAD